MESRKPNTRPCPTPLVGSRRREEADLSHSPFAPPRHTQFHQSTATRAATWCVGFLCLLPATSSRATPPTAGQIEFFESRIRPIFAENCYACHSAAEKIKGGLRLDLPSALLKGGENGPVIVPGDPDASRLIQAVRYTDEELQMPPKNKQLPADRIALLETWVKLGAPLPPDTGGKPLLTEVSVARTQHWAFQPVQKPAPPRVRKSSWVQTPVDNFILARLEAKNSSPRPGPTAAL